MTTYKRPDYVADAPATVTDVVDEMAVASVRGVNQAITVLYPKINMDSLEASQLMAAVFHRAEWLVLNGGDDR